MELREAEAEIERLTACLSYLVSCQAATVEGLPARTPKARAERHRSITRSGIEFLSGGYPRYPLAKADTLKRARNAVADQ